MNIRLTTSRIKCLSVVLLVFGIGFGWCLPNGVVARTIDLDHKKIPSMVFQDSSLKLVGTAVSGDPALSIAVIEDLKNGRQWSFHEGDRAGGLTIKTIYRHHMVIDAGKGEKAVRLKSFLDQAAAVAQGPPPQEKVSELSASSVNRFGSREHLYVIDRAAVESIFPDSEAISNQIDVMPARLFDRKTGFRIADFDAESIISKMGLRKGDLLMSINDHEIVGPEEAISTFEAIRDGGDIDLTVRRRARTYHINLLIE